MRSVSARLDVGARGHIEEGQQRRAVGQRQAAQSSTWPSLRATRIAEAAPLFRQIDDPRAQPVPHLAASSSDAHSRATSSMCGRSAARAGAKRHIQAKAD